MTQQQSPKKNLIELLGDKDRYCRIYEAAWQLFPESPHQIAPLIKTVLFVAGIPSPPIDDLAPFLMGFQRMRWDVAPRAFSVPEPGDIYVITDDARRPVEIGFVSKPSTDNTWFMKPDRERVEVDRVDFWMRLPSG